MKSVVDALGVYVGTAGHLGASTRRQRQELITRLSQDRASLRSYEILWFTMIGAMFALCVVALAMKLAAPYLVVPVGAGTAFMLIRRVETIWQQRERFTIALRLAIELDDEKVLRDVFAQLRSSFGSSTDADVVRKAKQPTKLRADA